MAHNPTWMLTYNGTPSVLNATWSKQYPFGDNDSFNGTLQQYKPGNVSVTNGNLILEARNTGGGNVGTGEYTSGMVASWNCMGFRYGYVEAMIQLPAGTGLWPAFWMLYQTVPLSNEVDIFEFGMSKPTLYHPGLYYTDPANDKFSASPPTVAVADSSATFHKYAVEWLPNSITYYFDDVVIYQNTIASEIPTQVMYVLMNLAVGGFFDGSPNGSTAFPADYQIQYLRIWQPPASLTPGVFMSTITATNAVTLCDAVAKHIIDAVALPGSTSTLTAGQATSLGHVAGLGDAGQITALLDSFNSSVNAENGYLNQFTAYNTILDIWFPVCVALDVATGGLNAFLIANQPNQVDPHFLDAFNRAQKRGAVNPVVALANWLAFGPATPSLATFTVTGSGAGTYAGGTGVAAAYGNAPLSIFNAGTAVIGAASITATVTYNKYSSTGVLQTGQTATATIANGAAIGASVALSGAAAGVAVTNITITGGTAADVIGVKGTLLRAVAY